MTDDGIGLVLVLVEEVGDAREGYLIDVFVDFFGRHAQSVVADGERLGLRIEGDADGLVAHFALEVALLGQGAQLLCGIDGIGNHLAKKDFMV